MKIKTLTLLMLILVAVIAFPAVAGAESPERNTMSWEDPSGSGLILTFSTPKTYSSCVDETTFDTIWTEGVPENWSVQGWVRVEYVTDSGRQLVQEYNVNQAGNLNLEISYPPVSEWPVMSNGTAEIHVDLSLGIYDENGTQIRWVGGDLDRAPGALGPGQDWDVYCITPPPPPSGGEGCTPGFWKNNADKKGADQWVNYSPDVMFDTVFSVNYVKTLLAALQEGGGQADALGRHATAALLNASNPNVNYLYTEGQIIQMVQDAYSSGQYEATKNLFAAQNEAGCPLPNNGKGGK